MCCIYSLRFSGEHPRHLRLRAVQASVAKVGRPCRAHSWHTGRLAHLSPPPPPKVVIHARLTERHNETSSAGVPFISAGFLQHAQEDKETVPYQVRDQMNIESKIDILLAPHNEDNGEPGQDAAGVQQGRPQVMKGEQ